MFRYFIVKWNLKTPGREDDGAYLYSKAEYQKAAAVSAAADHYQYGRLPRRAVPGDWYGKARQYDS